MWSPGLHHVLAYVKANEASAVIEVELGANATLVGFRQGGADDIVALRPADFEEGVGAGAGGNGAGAGLAGTFRADEGLVADASCATVGACGVVAPDGARRSFSGRWSTWEGAPGTWTFTRDATLSAEDDHYVVFGVDVALPSD